LKFTATGFSHTGTFRPHNQDSVLMHNMVFSSGEWKIETSDNTRFFIADGVGGAPEGQRASDFVLSELNQRFRVNDFPAPDEIAKVLSEINAALFDLVKIEPRLFGMATTLSGVFVREREFSVVNAGDSRVLLFSDGRLVQLTEDDILMNISGPSPITSFFGGHTDSLVPHISPVPAPLKAGDILMVASDGIFKCFTIQHLEKILSNSKSISQKALLILNNSLAQGAPDNISTIFIEISE